MLFNCLAAALRSARNDRLYALLNVIGLALGFGVVILICLFVRDELSFNHYLAGFQDLYRVQLTLADPGTRPVTLALTPERLASDLKLDFPEIVATTRDATQGVGLRHGLVEANESIEWVDPDFLTMMGYPMLRGDAATALAEPDTVVLTRKIALKYFGGIDCLGQTLDVDHIHPIRVTGIAEDPPYNSTLRFSALLSGKTGYGKLALLDAAPSAPGLFNVTLATYVRLRPGVTPDQLASRLPAFALRHYPAANGTEPMFASLFLKSLANIHLHPYNPDTDEPDDRTQTLVAVGATGALILILAVINFVNLVTARATQRAVEVGIRKSHGALRRQLMLQFMGEAFGYALVSTLLGMVLCAFSLPSLNAFLDRHIRFDFGHDPLLAIAPFAIAVVLGLLAGFYPAVILSRFSPALVLKAGAGATVGGSAMRLSLVAFQFTVTISLLIGALVMYRQISFASSQALGFDKDLVLTVELPGRPDLRTPDGLGQRMTGPVEAIRARLAAVHGVQATAASFVVPQMTQFTSLNFGRSDQPGGPAVTLNVLPVDFGYFDLYRIRLLAGRDFSRRFVDDKMVPDDPSRLSSAIINETTLHAFGFTDPQAAIGQEIHGMDQGVPERHFHIIGVVPDFPLDSIRNPVPPDLFVIDPDMFNVLSLKLSGADLPETLRGIDAAWHQAVPERPIHRMFLDDRIAGLYLDIGRNERLLAASAAFAVAIGCLGLIGLSAYTAERRTKEIGIRKALGASTSDIARLLIWQFAKPVLLANVLAWPIAWWFMRHWLNGFAYRIELGPEPFLFAGAAGLAIAVATTAFHAIHVARARPASALRYE